MNCEVVGLFWNSFRSYWDFILLLWHYGRTKVTRFGQIQNPESKIQNKNVKLFKIQNYSNWSFGGQLDAACGDLLRLKVSFI
jgi:hypothetical protein